MLPLLTVWVDPGKMTGIAAYVSVNLPQYRFSCDEYSFHAACDEVERMASMYGYSMALGWERFDITGQTHKKTREGTELAIKVIGYCEHMAWRYKCQVLTPAQQATPSAVEQAALRRLGWWVPGKDDAQSAGAHMLRWMLKSHQAPPQVVAAVQGEDQ